MLKTSGWNIKWEEREVVCKIQTPNIKLGNLLNIKILNLGKRLFNIHLQVTPTEMCIMFHKK